jgi:hypothetical protein
MSAAARFHHVRRGRLRGMNMTLGMTVVKR